MKIGEALKEERLKLGLSIRKMAEGIIDPTFLFTSRTRKSQHWI